MGYPRGCETPAKMRLAKQRLAKERSAKERVAEFGERRLCCGVPLRARCNLRLSVCHSRFGFIGFLGSFLALGCFENCVSPCCSPLPPLCWAGGGLNDGHATRGRY